MLFNVSVSFFVHASSSSGICVIFICWNFYFAHHGPKEVASDSVVSESKEWPMTNRTKTKHKGRNKGKSHYWFMTHNTFRAQRSNKAVSPVIRQPNTKAVVTTAVFADYVIVFQLSM